MELTSQAAFSSPYSSQVVPPNVEFSAKAAMKEKPMENTPTPPELNPAEIAPSHPAPAEERLQDVERQSALPLDSSSVGGAVTSPEADADPKAISASLRRLRQSGPLIIEAAKQKQGRFNEIVAQAVESMNEESAQPDQQTPNAIRPEQKTATEISGQKSGQKSGQAGAQSGLSSGLQATAQSVAQTAVNTVAAVAAATQSVARRTTDALASVANAAGSSTASSGSLSGGPSGGPFGGMMRSSTGPISNSAAFPPNGPSSVLVQASGLKPQSFGSKFRAGIIVLAILVGVGAYFFIKDKLLGAQPLTEADRILIGAEEQSEQFIRLGEQDREQGNYESAIAQFHRSLELTPNNQNARFLLAQSHLNSGQQEEALNAYQSLLRIAPEHLEARLQIAEIHRARGNWSGAYQEYQRIIALDQNSGQAQFALEVIEKYQAEHPDPANPGVESTRNPRDSRAQKKISPVLPSGIAARVQVPLLTQRSSSASNIRPPAALTSPRAEDNPDPRALADNHKKLGVRYLNIREYRAAINEFLSALRLTPEDKDLYYFIGSSYNGLNQPAQAYNYYRRVDSGPYVGPAQSGAKLTEKAARDDLKRRGQQLQNEVRNGPDSNKTGKPVANSLEE